MLSLRKELLHDSKTLQDVFYLANIPRYSRAGSCDCRPLLILLLLLLLSLFFSLFVLLIGDYWLN